MKIEELLRADSGLPLEKKSIIGLLYTASEINTKINDALKPFDISWQQFNVLRILRGQKGKPITLAEIQEHMISKMSNTTRLIDKLIKKDCVNRVINRKNKRKVDITITAAGLELLDNADDIMFKTESNIVSNLSADDKKELLRLLGLVRLIAN
jgi:DNA-binding MarR family transcriptional regulator